MPRMNKYNARNAAQVFREYSFVRFLKKFEIELEIYTNLNKLVEQFTIVIKNHSFIADSVFLVDVRKREVFDLDAESVFDDLETTFEKDPNNKKLTKYKIEIKNKVSLDNSEIVNTKNWKKDEGKL